MQISYRAEGSISHTVFTNLKKAEEKDWVSTSIFESFLGKLNKGKGYVSVEDPIQVENLNQIFKVFKDAFDKNIHTLANTSDILGSLSGRESFEVKRVS